MGLARYEMTSPWASIHNIGGRYGSCPFSRCIILCPILASIFLLACGGHVAPVPASISASTASTPTSQPSVYVDASYFGMHIQCVAAPCSTGSYPYPADMGFATLRLWDSSSWRSLENSSGSYDWTALDSLIDQALSHGVTSFVFTLGSVPAWASSTPSGDCGNSPPASCYPPDLPSMDEFLTTFVQRECGVVRYYETWNEANLNDFWNGTDSQMLTIAQHLYSIAKNAANCGCANGVCRPGGGTNPNKILTPSVNSIYSDSGRQWIESWLTLLQRSAVKTDIVAFHGYESQPETFPDKLAWLRSLADAHGFQSAELWDTEANWYGASLTEQEQAQAGWLMRSYIMQAASGVSRFYWYAYGSCAWGSLYGPACDQRGDAPAVRKAGIAYATVSKWLSGASIQGCRNEDQTWSCSLTRPNGYSALIMWSAQASPQADATQLGFTHYRDWQNTRHDLGPSIALSSTPVLLENQSVF